MDKYLTILFTDTHFGTHNSSMTWFKYQKDFIENQFIPHLQKRRSEGYKVRVVHCGDVFDSRSTINSYIANHVVSLFEKIIECSDYFVIVGGNHDYYSPTTDEVDTVKLVFDKLTLKYPNQFSIVTKNMQISTWGEETCIFAPWYEWLNQDTLNKMVEKVHPKYIFTHADLVRDNTDVDCPNIVSGHIHTPLFKGNIKNLGSCFALTFTDANQPRGFYEYEDGGEMKFIENTQSIRFWRFYDKDILKIPDEVQTQDYIELYASKTTLAKKKYVDACAKWTDKFKNIWIVPQVEQSESVEIKNFEGYDVETMISELIPEELKDKFEKIKQYININKDQ